MIGRAAGCDLVAADDLLSRRHAQLESREEQWWLRDLGSKNGTTVDGLALREGLELELASPSWLSLGGVEADFRRVSGDLRAAEQERRERLRRRTRQRRDELEPSLDFRHLLQRLLDSLLELTSAERAFVLLPDAAGELELIHSVGLDQDDVAAPSFSGSVTLIRRALESGASVLVSNVADETTLSGRPSVLAHEIRAMMCLPLRRDERLLGLLYLDSTRSDAVFEKLDVEILETLAERAAVALGARELELEIQQLAGELPTQQLSRFARDRGPGVPMGQNRRWTLSGMTDHHRASR